MATDQLVADQTTAQQLGQAKNSPGKRLMVRLVGYLLSMGFVSMITMFVWAHFMNRRLPEFGAEANLPISEQQIQDAEFAPYQLFINLMSPFAPENHRSALRTIETKWHPGSATMLVEVARFIRDPIALREAFAILHRKTGQSFGSDLNGWYDWIWDQPYNPHPEYSELKGRMYSAVDNRFAEYFQQTKDSKIRLDEIRWGGVARDGIPPLKNPKMLSANQANYLADTDVVFGISINGDNRCYPKRILAWHEMFKDTIGGKSFCGVY